MNTIFKLKVLKLKESINEAEDAIEAGLVESQVLYGQDRK